MSEGRSAKNEMNTESAPGDRELPKKPEGVNVAKQMSRSEMHAPRPSPDLGIGLGFRSP